jgi:hypothetical protein
LHFQFNEQFYDQIDGVAMGSPLGPLFANVFMSHFERKHMERMKELGLKTWMRFLDDIHATFQALMTIGSMFPFKDKVENVEERSMVVYCL